MRLTLTWRVGLVLMGVIAAAATIPMLFVDVGRHGLALAIGLEASLLVGALWAFREAIAKPLARVREVVAAVGPSGERAEVSARQETSLRRAAEGFDARLRGLVVEHTRTAELNARLASVMEQAAEAVMMTTLDGHIIYVNPAFERITGYSSAEALGQTPRLFKGDRQDRAIYHDLWQTILKGQVWRSEITNRRKDGVPFTWEEAITPVRDEQGRLTHFVAVGQDVSTERQLQAQLMQAQKMEAIGRLAGGVAHDFNNLLTVITGYSEQLVQTLPSEDPLHRKADAIRGAADRAASLTQQLLAFSRRQMQQPRVLELNDAVGRMDNLIRRLIGEDIELITSLEATPDRVKADPNQLEQVLMNLAVNARDAMPRGGTLTIETSTITLDGAYLACHPTMRSGTYVMLAVTDTGCGMDAETRRRLFEPFFTTKEQGKGTGLGLSTVYGVVKQHGGHIWVYSEPGQGSVFKIYLPLARETVEDLALPAPLVSAPRGVETVLVVEDDDEVRRLLKDTLQQFGYTVLEAHDGSEALLFCTRYSGPIHLLVTDIVMPQMDGHEVAERLHRLRPTMRTLFISGYTEQVAARQGRAQVGDAFLAKPFTPDALARKVREVIGIAVAA